MLYFDTLKEKRKDYFVEYKPGIPLSFLILTFVNDPPKEKIVKQLMEQELEYWWIKYPVNIQVFACDNTDDGISDRIRYLVGVPHNNKLKLYWNAIDDKFLCKFSEEQFISIHKNVTYKTQIDVDKNVDDFVKTRCWQIYSFKFLYIIFRVILPIIWLTLLQFSSYPLICGAGFLLFAYDVIERIIDGLNTWHLINHSPKVLEELRIQNEKEHCYYHCKKNPTGFLRLKSENFDHEAMLKNKEDFDKI